VAGSISRTQLFEREGPSAAAHARDLFTEQIRFLQAAGVDFLILETFFHLQEMLIALECARASGLPMIAMMSFRPRTTACSDGYSPAECARAMMAAGAQAIGANCEQEPSRMLSILREMRGPFVVRWRLQPNLLPSIPPRTCSALRVCPSSRTTWKRSRSRVATSSGLARPREKRVLATSVAVAALTQPTSGPCGAASPRQRTADAAWPTNQAGKQG
jgi:hypothetical protein